MMTSLMCLFVVLSAHESAGGTKVAVVDVPAVSDAYYKRTTLESDFEGLRAKFREAVDKEKAEIEKLRRSADEQLKPGTPEYDARKDEAMMHEARLKIYMEREGARLDGEVNRSLREIFDDIHAMVGQIAEQDGIDIVIAKDELPPNSASTSEVLRQQIMLHKVMYFKPSVNITEKVIQQLNDAFVKAGGKIPPAKAPAAPAAAPAEGAKKD